MTVTPNFGWRIPDEDSSTEIYDHFENLGTDADATVKEIGEMTSFAPTFTDGTNNLELGTGGSLIGRTGRINSQRIIDVQILRGNGAWQGSGLWIIGNLPLTTHPDGDWWMTYGFGYLTGAGKNHPLTVYRVGGNSVGLLGPGGRISNTYPGSWATSGGERIGVRIFCENAG